MKWNNVNCPKHDTGGGPCYCRQITRPDDINVSDHAVVRYVQRVMGLDIDKLKQEIVPNEQKALIVQLGGSGSFPVDGYTLKVKNGVVVTIYADEPK